MRLRSRGCPAPEIEAAVVQAVRDRNAAPSSETDRDVIERHPERVVVRPAALDLIVTAGKEAPKTILAPDLVRAAVAGTLPAHAGLSSMADPRVSWARQAKAITVPQG